jgi:two-component system, chemotaxis family, response regulator Rcp1
VNLPPVHPIEILLVEDSPADTELAQEVLRDAKVANVVHAVDNGDDAIAFVRRTGRFARTPRPDLILLDLNLPGRDGREVLEELKEDPELRTIPVIVLTTSAEAGDVERAYKSYVNAYITKPLNLDAFASVARSIEDFWLTLVRLPSR